VEIRQLQRRLMGAGTNGGSQTTFAAALNGFAIGELTSAPPGGHRPQREKVDAVDFAGF
jgi:hypothetical protein